MAIETLTRMNYHCQIICAIHLVLLAHVSMLIER